MMFWGAGSMWWMWLWPLLFIALIVWIVHAVTRGTQAQLPHPPTERTGDEAMEILRRRYARGEISEEEFDQHRRMLKE
ncbi:MAG: SHOCT domain-containing protein [Candidatus Bipolaricaulia bacterium]